MKSTRVRWHFSLLLFVVNLMLSWRFRSGFSSSVLVVATTNFAWFFASAASAVLRLIVTFTFSLVICISKQWTWCRSSGLRLTLIHVVRRDYNSPLSHLVVCCVQRLRVACAAPWLSDSNFRCGEIKLNEFRRQSSRDLCASPCDSGMPAWKMAEKITSKNRRRKN